MPDDPGVVGRGSWPVVVIKGDGGFEVSHHQTQIALGLVDSRVVIFRPGYRYQLRMTLEGGEAPLSGEGI